MAKTKTKSKAKSGTSDSAHMPPRSDAYTGLLVVSLLALLGGSALLFLDYNEYKEKKPPNVPTTLPKPATPPAQ